jgi:K+-transporting ATPase ATPase B chain
VRTGDGMMILKGAVDAIGAGLDGAMPREVLAQADLISDQGATPLAIRNDGRVLGLIELKDTVKEGLVERFEEFRRMGIRTVMITGDNPRTAATIAKEAGVDDFIAQATPEDKIAFIRKEQADGHLVAMTGDGTNDAPAVAQADVGLAMVTARQRARRRPTWSTSTPTRPAAGGHRHRQAAAHHARFDHDVQHRQ